jgi:hypothetical protein
MVIDQNHQKTNWKRVAKAHKALAAAEVAALKAQAALDKTRCRFNRAADILEEEGQSIDYRFDDLR